MNRETKKAIEELKEKVKLFDTLREEIYKICEGMNYKNSSNFSYNIDRLNQFTEGILNFVPDYEAGDYVKFKNPTPEEKNEIFTIVEDRDDKVLVRLEDSDIVDVQPIRPTFVYLKSEMVLI